MMATVKMAANRSRLFAAEEGMMIWKFSVANKLVVALGAVAIIAVGFGATSAEAQPKKRQHDSGRPYYGPNGPNVVYRQGAHTRIYVTKRSWLDAGTEVLPGDRKFTDYAFPSPYGYPSFGRENLNRPIDRQPLSTPSDLGGYYPYDTGLY
jgi:hypothetical protein